MKFSGSVSSKCIQTFLRSNRERERSKVKFMVTEEEDIRMVGVQDAGGGGG